MLEPYVDLQKIRPLGRVWGSWIWLSMAYRTQRSTRESCNLFQYHSWPLIFFSIHNLWWETHLVCETQVSLMSVKSQHLTIYHATCLVCVHRTGSQQINTFLERPSINGLKGAPSLHCDPGRKPEIWQALLCTLFLRQCLFCLDRAHSQSTLDISLNQKMLGELTLSCPPNFSLLIVLPCLLLMLPN